MLESSVSHFRLPIFTAVLFGAVFGWFYLKKQNKRKQVSFIGSLMSANFCFNEQFKLTIYCLFYFIIVGAE